MIRIKNVEKDDEQKDEKDDQWQEVSKHNSGVQAESLDDDVVQEDSDEAGEDVDQADVEDDGGAGELVLEKVCSGHKTVVWKQKPHAWQNHHQVHIAVLKIHMIIIQL